MGTTGCFESDLWWESVLRGRAKKYWKIWFLAQKEPCVNLRPKEVWLLKRIATFKKGGVLCTKTRRNVSWGNVRNHQDPPMAGSCIKTCQPFIWEHSPWDPCSRRATCGIGFRVFISPCSAVLLSRGSCSHDLWGPGSYISWQHALALSIRCCFY